jgi:2-acylglycerol O-acyltransferase 2
MPFYRDILLALGVCSVSKQSCSNILKSGPGSAITIVVGGAAESLSAHPGTADLTLRRRSGLDFLDALVSTSLLNSFANRLGFIKLAIQHGCVPKLTFLCHSSDSFIIRADLVPVFSFGENDVYQYFGQPR